MQWEKHKKAKEQINEIFMRPDKYRVIHYSRQGFSQGNNQHADAIVSIAIYSGVSDATFSVDIQSMAERLQIRFQDISQRIREIETEMLREFFDYINQNRDFIYLHWNMRDNQFGFQALSNRYCALTNGKPAYEIPIEKQLNVSNLLEEYYGSDYVAHPRLKNIIEQNPESRPLHFLNATQEENAFKEGRYNDLHMSTLSKVRFFYTVLTLVHEGKLKVSTSKLKAFGFSPQVIFEMVKDTWWWGLLTFLLGMLLGKVL